MHTHGEVGIPCGYIFNHHKVVNNNSTSVHLMNVCTCMYNYSSTYTYTVPSHIHVQLYVHDCVYMYNY